MSRNSLTGEVLSKSRAHLRVETGFDFKSRIPARENFNFRAGMIQFAQLRSALFAQYAI
jgi:hypothetical protein